MVRKSLPRRGAGANVTTKRTLNSGAQIMEFTGRRKVYCPPQNSLLLLAERSDLGLHLLARTRSLNSYHSSTFDALRIAIE